MRASGRSEEAEALKEDRRKNWAERRRRQREIDEERQRRIQVLSRDLRVCGF
jgi:hypothetical protein